MKISIGELRDLIRECILVEYGGGTRNRPQPTQNPSAPSPVTRQELGRISVKDMDVDEISPHLRDDFPQEDEDPWGPVPPFSDKPGLFTVDYAKDWGVLPSGGRIGR